MANLVWIVPAWIAVGALLAAAGHTYRRLTGGKRHLPAAPDNTPGRDPHLLWECRHIHAQPTANTRREKL
jgi:hypothetical protein